MFGVHRVPAAFVRQQIEVVLGDIGADAVKTGMLVDADIIEAVADVLETFGLSPPLVLDPVMISKSGAALLELTAINALKRRLIPMAALLTPNIPEAEALLGHPITAPEAAAIELLNLGPQAVLLKGGHWPGHDITDILATQDGTQHFTAPRLPGLAAHGTGCALASAIATGLAQGMDLPNAIARAQSFVRDAIRTSPKIGSGHPVLNHGGSET